MSPQHHDALFKEVGYWSIETLRTLSQAHWRKKITSLSQRAIDPHKERLDF
jgi:hypothetical protein